MDKDDTALTIICEYINEVSRAYILAVQHD